MSFSVSFQHGGRSGVESPVSVNLERGADYETLVMEACGALAASGGSRFHVGGFGTNEWPLDVGYDLSAFMEQFPSLLAGVREFREVEVEFYSQGIERTLTFRPSGDFVSIRCESRTSWIPNPDHEQIAQAELVAMLSKLAKDFAQGLKEANLDLSTAAPFDRWSEGEV